MSGQAYRERESERCTRRAGVLLMAPWVVALHAFGIDVLWPFAVFFAAFDRVGWGLGGVRAPVAAFAFLLAALVLAQTSAVPCASAVARALCAPLFHFAAPAAALATVAAFATLIGSWFTYRIWEYMEWFGTQWSPLVGSEWDLSGVQVEGRVDAEWVLSGGQVEAEWVPSGY